MKKIELLWEPYELKLLKPFETAKGVVTHRKGFIIQLTNENGVYGRGDICPFPQFGSETYEEAEKFLNSFTQNLSLNLDDIQSSFDNNFNGAGAYPAAKCGLEQALFTLIAREQKTSLNHLLDRKSRQEVKVNGVIGLLNSRKSAALAEELVQEGFTTIKLKAGREKFTEDLEVIKAVNSAVPASIKLRVDVNGLWSSDQASENLRQLDKFNIEYIEQPVSTADAFNKLAKETSIPLAADESVRNMGDAVRLIKEKSVKFLILKPMMIGGILPMLKIYDLAKKNDIGVVITSSFESGIGRGYAVFAASLIVEDTAHGLNTMHLFESKILPETYAVKKGVIHL
jgi:o-succinylbenzoate synthase